MEWYIRNGRKERERERDGKEMGKRGQDRQLRERDVTDLRQWKKGREKLNKDMKWEKRRDGIGKPT